MVTIAACPIGTLSVVLSWHHGVYNLVDNIRQWNLLIDAVIRDDLNVVFFFILWEQKSEAPRAYVLPPILVIEPVKLSSILLRWENHMGVQGVWVLAAPFVELSLKLRLHFCKFSQGIESFVILSLIGCQNDWFLVLARFTPVLKELTRAKVITIDTHVAPMRPMMMLHSLSMVLVRISPLERVIFASAHPCLWTVLHFSSRPLSRCIRIPATPARYHSPIVLHSCHRYIDQIRHTVDLHARELDIIVMSWRPLQCVIVVFLLLYHLLLTTFLCKHWLWKCLRVRDYSTASWVILRWRWRHTVVVVLSAAFLAYFIYTSTT